MRRSVTALDRGVGAVKGKRRWMSCGFAHRDGGEGTEGGENGGFAIAL